MTRKIVLLSLIFSLLMIALVSFVAMAMFGNECEETPDVIGKSVKEAEQIFNKNNLKFGKISRSYHDKYPENEIIRQLLILVNVLNVVTVLMLLYQRALKRLKCQMHWFT